MTSHWPRLRAWEKKALNMIHPYRAVRYTYVYQKPKPGLSGDEVLSLLKTPKANEILEFLQHSDF
jgi:hypothetical protein